MPAESAGLEVVLAEREPVAMAEGGDCEASPEIDQDVEELECTDLVGLPSPQLVVATHLLNANTRTSSLVGKLLDHYVRNVANLLQPVLHARNTYSSIYAQEAMMVATRAPWREAGRHSNGWNSKVALMYSLLASSSFHLRGSNTAGDASAMARYFRMHAVSHLRMALDSLRGTGDSAATLSQSEAVLKVMLTLVTADMDEFWIYLDATRELVLRLQDRVQPGSPGEHLINISCFLRILSDSTDVGLEPVAWSPDTDGTAVFLGGEHSLEFTYGITARLTSFLSRACLLARHASYYRTTGAGTLPPDGFARACTALQEDLAAWHISQEALPSFRGSDDLTVLLVSKHMRAFAAGIQIYFYARVTPCDPDTMTGLVRSMAAHLASIEAIKTRTGYGATPTATITWPGFIAACQAREPELRAAWAAWWQQMLGYGIGNIQDLWSVVQEAWAAQDSGEAQSDEAAWAVVLRRTGRRILAI